LAQRNLREAVRGVSNLPGVALISPRSH